MKSHTSTGACSPTRTQLSYETPDFWYCHTAGDGGENNSISWRHHSYDIGNCASVPKPPKGKKARRRRSIRPIKRIISAMASFQGQIYFSKSRLKTICAPQISHHALPRQLTTALGSKSSNSLSSTSLKNCPQAKSGWLSRKINSLQSPWATLPLIQTILAP